jgi:hypothetical protein
VASQVPPVFRFLGNANTAGLTPFTLNVSVNPGYNTLDFIFTGCVDAPVCSGGEYPDDEPISALYTDPSGVPTAPGTVLENIPEGQLAADAAAGGSQTPEPGSLAPLGLALLGMAILSFRRQPRKKATPRI